MTDSPPNPPAAAPASVAPVELDETARRLQALQQSRGRGSSSAPAGPATPAASRPAGGGKPRTPAPGRILAAAASVSAGIGLMALMSGASQDVVIQVEPAPVVVQPAGVIVTMPDGTELTEQPQITIVEAATPPPRPVPAPGKAVTVSEGS